MLRTAPGTAAATPALAAGLAPAAPGDGAGGPRDDADDPGDDDDDTGPGRRRRRRSSRGRGRNGDDATSDAGDGQPESPDTSSEDQPEAEGQRPGPRAAPAGRGPAAGGPGAVPPPTVRTVQRTRTRPRRTPRDDDDGSADDDPGGTGRRRRRKRRRGSADGPDSLTSDDPPDTVVHVREPNGSPSGSAPTSNNDVRSVKGSTRLEAKKQRRREGRETGRRRPPIVTESEFLARRESVERSMIVRQREDRTQIAVLEDDVLVEHYVNRSSHAVLRRQRLPGQGPERAAVDGGRVRRHRQGPQRRALRRRGELGRRRPGGPAQADRGTRSSRASRCSSR